METYIANLLSIYCPFIGVFYIVSLYHHLTEES